jgi:AcrR family transcriptional regulator
MKAQSKAQLLESFQVERVREAALRVTSRCGLAKATMQAIADEAGVAKGTLYLYFKSRNDLIERTAEFAFSQLLAQLESTLAGEEPVPERLQNLVLTKIEFFDRHREFLRLYLATCHAGKEAHASLRSRRMNRPQYIIYLERLAGFLSEGMKRKEVRDADPMRLALLLAEAVNAILLHRLSEPSPPPAGKDVGWIVETLLYGVAARGRS